MIPRIMALKMEARACGLTNWKSLLPSQSGGLFASLSRYYHQPLSRRLASPGGGSSLRGQRIRGHQVAGAP
jgi:hypothetical protein